MNLRVLIADDSSTIRAMVINTLETLSVTAIVEAEDGTDALEAFRQEDFDLLVVDWQMPGLNGLEVVEAVRSAGSAVPIVMITGVATGKEHVLSAMKAGVSDYLIKPFDLGVLRGKLGKHCQSIKLNKKLAPA